MTNRTDAKDAVKELALAGHSTMVIESKLAGLGLGGLFERSEIEALAREVRAVQNLLPPQPSKVWPRIVGGIAVLMGIWAISIGGCVSARWSPAGYGFSAVVLGIILIVKPGWSKNTLD